MAVYHYEWYVELMKNLHTLLSEDLSRKSMILMSYNPEKEWY
jgi:hypothetical protein